LDLAGVQARVRDINPVYVDMLFWEQTGDIVKACFKGSMSAMAFDAIKHVFTKLGGHYVCQHGKGCWFELVLRAEPCGSGHLTSNNQTPKGIIPALSSPAPGSALTRLQDSLTRIGHAGAELLAET